MCRSAAALPRQASHVLPQWADALHEITGASPIPSIAVICGAKNNSKSTYSRLLLNSLLQRYDRVDYLDTDGRFVHEELEKAVCDGWMTAKSEQAREPARMEE
ncbi:Polynucleotide 5'-hydroxyl-kinase NOL9 [Platanthera zijinensis]|uniref:Polynucleotide 5'-hydroxyl-kinase NOL9 n=1 Tax=Platanthera zijinensis TaxID=2320716 RepID=A0AAP0BGV6_9ASPA